MLTAHYEVDHLQFLHRGLPLSLKQLEKELEEKKTEKENDSRQVTRAILCMLCYEIGYPMITKVF